MFMYNILHSKCEGEYNYNDITIKFGAHHILEEYLSCPIVTTDLNILSFLLSTFHAKKNINNYLL